MQCYYQSYWMYLWCQPTIILFWHTSLYLQIIPTLRTYIMTMRMSPLQLTSERTLSMNTWQRQIARRTDINNYLSDAGAAGPQVTRVVIFGHPFKHWSSLFWRTQKHFDSISFSLSKKFHWKVALRVPMSINHHRQKSWFWRKNFERRVRVVSINVVVRYRLEKSYPIALKYASDEIMTLVIRLMECFI